MGGTATNIYSEGLSWLYNDRVKVEMAPPAAGCGLIGPGLSLDESTLSLLESASMWNRCTTLFCDEMCDFDAEGLGHIQKAFFTSPMDAELAEKKGINATWIPDLVFAAAQTAPVAKLIDDPPQKAGKVGVITEDFWSMEVPSDQAYLDFSVRAIAGFLDSIDSSQRIVFIPLTTSGAVCGLRAARDIGARMKRGNKRLIDAVLPTRRLFKLVLELDYAVCLGRTAAAVAASGGVPFVFVSTREEDERLIEHGNLQPFSVRPYCIWNRTFGSLLDAAESPSGRERMYAWSEGEQRRLRDFRDGPVSISMEAPTSAE
ncbi:hypothetical protein H0Z60_03095 [Ectothiorhodospiraceae bacterium WFHF3C12]|nr:hypothetical protein [Ectothiorhodospiraceae bacterium WFHF3C12]